MKYPTVLALLLASFAAVAMANFDGPDGPGGPDFDGPPGHNGPPGPPRGPPGPNGPDFDGPPGPNGPDFDGPPGPNGPPGRPNGPNGPDFDGPNGPDGPPGPNGPPGPDFDGPNGPPRGPPGPDGPDGPGPNAQGGPDGPDGPPPPPPHRPPPPHHRGPGGPGDFALRKTRHFRPNEEILLRGGRCYLRPQCPSELQKSPFKGKLKGPRLVCDNKTKPTPNKREFIWKAQPCNSPQNKKRGVVRFENGKHRNKFLCLSCSPHKGPKRRQAAHFGIMGCRKNKGCTWRVKEAKVYNRKTKRLENRFVFINQDFKHYMLRIRRQCKKSPPGPKGTFAAQNYLSEGQVDAHGSFAIEPVPKGGYQV